MTEVLSSLEATTDPALLVGFDGSDDAGVYRLDAERALVVTADFITPPSDDPEVYGRIAAANALSDVYAMGGRPLVCLNLACFPSAKLGSEVLGGILRGAAAKVAEAGAVIGGGHTVEDEEPKFGLSVTGSVHPDRIWTNAGARPGDRLILTKPIGSGVLFNANLKGLVSREALDDCVRRLGELNARAAEVLGGYSVHAATDVTGFGLCGHALEMARGAQLTLEIDSAEVPLLAEARAMYERGVSTGANKTNRKVVEPVCDLTELSPIMRELMVDPQTSGGLLVAVPEAEAGDVLAELHRSGVDAAAVIGRVGAYDGRSVVIR